PNAISSWLANLAAIQTFAPSYATQQAWNAPSWSISTELFFYLAFPFILLAIARRATTRARLLGVLALGVAYAVAMQAAVLALVYWAHWDYGYWLDVVA